MDTSVKIYSPSEFFNSMKPMMESAAALNQVLTNAINEMREIQSESYAATFAESMLALAPAFAPGGATHSAWQIPSWCQSQAERIARSALDSFGVLSKSQQKILEMMGASLSQTAQQTATAISKMNATFASRRVSAQIIDFADRRAMAEAESKAAGEASAQHRASQRWGKKSVG